MDEIVAIIDKSYSMMGYEEQTISGYNEFIQKQLDISGNARVTLILFDDQYEEIYSKIPIAEVPDLTRDIYKVRGATALNDAIGKAVKDISNYQEIMVKKPKATIVAIFTDGQENDSKEFTPEMIKTLITEMEAHKGWEFTYTGCDHDVIGASRSLGIKSQNTVSFNKSNLVGTMAGAYSDTVACYRSSSNTKIDVDIDTEI